MRKQLSLIGLLSIFSIIIFFLAACNGTNSTPPLSDSSAAVVKDTAAKIVTPRYSLSGYLDYLWIDPNIFQKLKRKITFRFIIKYTDSLTLRGWSGKETQYGGAKYDVILNNGRQSDSAQFGQDSYFGNLQLSTFDIGNIQDSAAKYKSKYIVFIPMRPITGGGQINYNIVVTSDDPHSPDFKSNPLTTTQTNVFLNPSPPKNSVQ